MYKIDTNNLQDIISGLEAIRETLEAEAGEEPAANALGFVTDALEYIKTWVGVEIDPAAITGACAQLDKALDILREGEYYDTEEQDLADVRFALGLEERAAKGG